MYRILIATLALTDRRTGTEIVAFESALGLRRRGYDVAIFAHRAAGGLADKLRDEGFTVVTDIGSVPWEPDLIQANQTYPLVHAFARFPNLPILSICHDAKNWFNEPVNLPTICQHAAVSIACRDRVVSRLPHLPKDVELLHNAVDLDAFHIRAPLPSRPRRALILSHHDAHIGLVRAACDRLAIEVDALGSGARRVVSDLPYYLSKCDLVFATGRMALEAMAVGCAVIVADYRGLAGMVTSDVVGLWRDHNFGFALLTRPLSHHAVAAEIKRYDASDAAQVCETIRRESSLDGYLDRLELIYKEIVVRNTADKLSRNVPLELLGSFDALLSALQSQLSVLDAENTRVRKYYQSVLSLSLDREPARLLPSWVKTIARAVGGRRM
jgi:hypothetical protein